MRGTQVRVRVFLRAWFQREIAPDESHLEVILELSQISENCLQLSPSRGRERWRHVLSSKTAVGHSSESDLLAGDAYVPSQEVRHIAFADVVYHDLIAGRRHGADLASARGGYIGFVTGLSRSLVCLAELVEFLPLEQPQPQHGHDHEVDKQYGQAFWNRSCVRGQRETTCAQSRYVWRVRGVQDA